MAIIENMIRILVMLVICNIVISTEDVDNKFIDLLPAKEKKAFLDRIARRILEKVKSKDIPDGSRADISDEQLDAQTAFVQEILREESEYLKKKRRNNKYRKNGEEVKPVTENTGEVEPQDKHIDLTLRSKQKPIIRRNEEIVTQQLENTSESTGQTIIVDTLYDSKYDYNYSLKNTQTISDTRTDTDVKNSFDLNFDTNLTNNDDLKIGTITALDFNTKAIDNFENVSTYSSTSYDRYEGETTTKSSKIMKQSVAWDLTNNLNAKQEYYNQETSGENDHLTSNKAETLLDSTTSRTRTTSELNETIYDLITSNSHKEDDTTIKVKKREEKPDGKENITINLTNVLQNNTNTDKNRFYTESNDLFKNHKLTLISEIDENTLKLSKTTNEPTYFEPRVGHSTENKEEKESEERNKGSDLKKIQNDAQNGRLLNDINKKMYLRTNDEDDTVAERSRSTTPKDRIHEVYEIDPRDSPFVVSETVKNKNDYEKIEKNTEASQYVSIYDYDPTNAYFNSHSRFLTKDENQDNKDKQNELQNDKELSNDNLLNKNILRSWFGENNKRSVMIKSTPPKVNDPTHLLLHIINMPKVKHMPTIYTNPDDYVDYYLGRSLIKKKNKKYVSILDSNEEHLNDSLKERNIKNRLRTARYLLNLNQSLGHMPPSDKIKSMEKQSELFITKKLFELKPRTGNELIIKKENSQNQDQSIALDYYFGRQGSDEIIDDYQFINTNLLTKSPMHKQFQKKVKLSNKSKTKTNARNYNVTIRSIVTVLKDLIKLNNQALSSYPWLKSTVEIRAGIYKVLDLIDSFHYKSYVHPKDIELLKYIFYLYKYSNLMMIKEEKLRVIRDTRKKSWLPKNKKKRRIKEPWKMIRDVYSFLRDSEEDQPFLILHELEDFLNEVLFNLDLFHKVIRRIAVAKTYKSQNWFYDLKFAFLKSANTRELKQVLLHLSMHRLFGKIEQSSRSIVEDGFKNYVQNNRITVEDTRDEFSFVLKLLQELRFSVNK